tara:strand:- start:1309 stop:1434 length:126 start_codon:yes stop_codon:yes gene_type:complete
MRQPRPQSKYTRRYIDTARILIDTTLFAGVCLIILIVLLSL